MYLPTLSSLGRLTTLAPVLAVLACVPHEEDEGDIAAVETSAAVSSSFDLIGVSGHFAAADTLGLLPVRLARAQALQDAVQAMVGSVRDDTCLTVDTDGESFVEVVFDACPTGILRLRETDGSLRADLAFETAPCGLDECPVAVRYTLSTPRLRLGSVVGPWFVEIAGSWALRDPMSSVEPTTWDAGLTMANHRGRSLAMSSRASWVSSNACTTLDVDAELTIAGHDALGTIATSARDVVRCTRECPTGGTVQLAYGLGRILRWTYTGEATVVVEGPRGRRFEAPLACGDA